METIHFLSQRVKVREIAENTIKEFKILQEIYGEDKLPLSNITRMDKIVDK